MAELTKERLQQIVHAAGLEPWDYEEVFDSITTGEIVMMARQLLAGLEQEPVAQVYQPANIGICAPLGPSVMMLKPLSPGAKLYAAPQLPQPAVVSFDEWSRKCDLQIELCDQELREKGRYIWDEACRAAMLQGAEPVTTFKPSIFIDGNISPDDADKLAETIRKLNSEHREPQQMIAEPVQRWIPCSERMPERSDDVLCATEFDGPGDWRKKVGYWHKGKWVIYGASWTPTYWMTLPSAPDNENSII